MPNTLLFIFFPQNGFSSVQPTPLQTTQAVEGESASAVDVLGLLYCWDSVLWMKSFTWPNRKSFPCWTKCCHSHCLLTWNCSAFCCWFCEILDELALTSSP